MNGFSMADYDRATRQLQSAPDQFFSRAESGGIAETLVLTNTASRNPSLQTARVLQIFCRHLDAGRVPAHHSSTGIGTREDLASSSLLGIGNLGAQVVLDKIPGYIPILVDAWPGIYRWMRYFDTRNRDSSSPIPAMKRAIGQEVIAHALYALTGEDDIRPLAVATDGLVELITKLWLDEDKNRTTAGEGSLRIRAASCALHTTLFTADAGQLDEVVRFSGGDYEFVADLAVGRLRDMLDHKPPPPQFADHVFVYIDTLVTLTRCPCQLRQTILDCGAIVHVTRTLNRLSGLLSDGSAFRATMSCFGFICNVIEEGEEAANVRQTVRNGMLEAFVNFMPKMATLGRMNQSFLKKLIGDIIPRYLVYRSVIMTVIPAMDKIDANPVYVARIRSSSFRDAWEGTKRLAKERWQVKDHSDALKNEKDTCDNCHARKPRTEFRKCSSCHVALYCSKDCQVTAWKTKHKKECMSRNEERASADRSALKKQDRVFLQHLATHDAVKNLLELRRIANRDFPTVQHSQLGIKIDFSHYPPKYGVFRPESYETRSSGDARVVAKAIAGQGRYTLVQTIISAGRSNSLGHVLSAGSIWDAGDTALAIMPWAPSAKEDDDIRAADGQMSSEVD
ncbi:hypothetical protein PENSPDRAFT_630153 [Peniophora sp. CONT]|nr:hypothetical protein PENSPDRAFT_630153 [Peniophora sp. CONT]